MLYLHSGPLRQKKKKNKKKKKKLQDLQFVEWHWSLRSFVLGQTGSMKGAANTHCTGAGHAEPPQSFACDRIVTEDGANVGSESTPYFLCTDILASVDISTKQTVVYQLMCAPHWFKLACWPFSATSNDVADRWCSTYSMLTRAFKVVLCCQSRTFSRTKLCFAIQAKQTRYLKEKKKSFQFFYLLLSLLPSGPEMVHWTIPSGP